MTVEQIWNKFIEAGAAFMRDSEGIVTNVIHFVFDPIGDAITTSVGWPSLPQWIQDILLPFINRYSVFDLILGIGISAMLIYTMIRWIVGIVTGS